MTHFDYWNLELRKDITGYLSVRADSQANHPQGLPQKEITASTKLTLDIVCLCVYSTASPRR